MPKKIPKIVKQIRNNPPEKVNYAYQKNISFSQASIYNGCPYRWKLQYKDKVKAFTSSIHTIFGTSIHETLQEYLDILYSETATKADKMNLEELFQDKFVNEYQKEYKSNNNKHFSSAEEMREFYEDGVGILEWVKKKRGKFFSKRGWYLVGCEIPIVISPLPKYSSVLYMGYLDVVMYHEPTNTFKIIDIKTSTRGWKDREKKDEEKQFQLLLYKNFFSSQYNIPIDNIDIEFFIVKRKVLDWDDENLMSPYQAHRVQTFTPPNGKIKINKSKQYLENFLTECFTPQGKIQDKEYPKKPSKWNCRFCPFSENDHCGEGKKFKF